PQPAGRRCGQFLVAADPQPALAVRPAAAGGLAFAAASPAAAEEHLVGQTQDAAAVGLEGQEVEALIAVAAAVADATELAAQGLLGGEVQFGDVARQDDGAGVLPHAPQGEVAVGPEHGTVGDRCG